MTRANENFFSREFECKCEHHLTKLNNYKQMKKILVFVLLLFTVQTQAQFDNYLNTNEAVVDGGIGMSWIDGEPYYTFRFRPEVSFGQFGMGLDLNLEFTENGIRT